MSTRKVMHLRDLTPDPANARRHNPKNIGMIVDAMHEVGAARSIVIDEAGTVLAGNGAVEAAAEAGITKVQVVDADGETLVAVRRTGLTERQKRRLALFDNRTQELSGWDDDVLAAMHEDDVGVLDGIFDAAEIAALGAEDTAPVEEVEIPRPMEVVWVLAAVPLEKWGQVAAQVDALAADAEVMVKSTRPR